MSLMKFAGLGRAAIALMLCSGSIADADVVDKPAQSADVEATLVADHEEGLTAPIPDLAVARGDLGYEGKYIVFYKSGATVSETEEDLRFCWRFLAHGVMRRTPSFLAWQQSEAARPVDYSLTMYGLVGVGIGAIIQGPLERSIRQLRFYSCMLPRGYDRYRTSETIWNRLNDDDHPERSILWQARIAAGPVPPTDKVVN